MRQIVLVLSVAALVACGAETMGTAATAAAVKKQELEQGKKNMEQMQQKIGQAMQQVEQSAQRRNEAAGQ